MKENKLNPTHQAQQNMDNSNRRAEERRSDACEGYTYVSTVGWICRRENSRRKDQDQARSQSSGF